MRARTLIMGGLVTLALSGCAGQGNAATTPVTPTHGDGGNFMQFYERQLQHPPTDNICRPKTVEQLLVPCDEGGTP
jgi:hypothetical protein